jgi:hypothetical protein
MIDLTMASPNLSLRVLRSGGIGAVKTIKNPGKVFRRNPGAGVFHTDFDVLSLRRLNGKRNPPPAWSKLERIREMVAHRPPE